MNEIDKIKKEVLEDNSGTYFFKPGDWVRHFKGNTYEIINIATHTETGEKLVIYKGLDTNKIWARPFEMFNSEVDHEKYPNVEQKMRFEKIDKVYVCSKETLVKAERMVKKYNLMRAVDELRSRKKT